MRNMLMIGALASALVISAAHAEPIKLKLSYYSSDRALAYIATTKPFVDAVNAEGKGRLEIVPYFSGSITPVQAEQPEAVADGRADLAITIPSYSPERFPDMRILELPGLFRDAPEATYVFDRLIDKGALGGFEDFIVIGATVGPAEIINTRKKTASLADLRGQTIRVNNPAEGDALRHFGATPVLLSVKNTADALARGKVDGATSPPSKIFEFGIGRLTSEHYSLQIGGVASALIMNRKKFDSLPPEDQTLIRKYSRDWLDKQAAIFLAAKDKEVFAQISADPRRTVVSPSPADLAESQRVFNSVIEEWAQAKPGNQALLALAREEIANYRKGE